jgi:hypothetical protein
MDLRLRGTENVMPAFADGSRREQPVCTGAQFT